MDRDHFSRIVLMLTVIVLITFSVMHFLCMSFECDGDNWGSQKSTITIGVNDEPKITKMMRSKRNSIEDLANKFEIQCLGDKKSDLCKYDYSVQSKDLDQGMNEMENKDKAKNNEYLEMSMINNSDNISDISELVEKMTVNQETLKKPYMLIEILNKIARKSNNDVTTNYQDTWTEETNPDFAKSFLSNLNNNNPWDKKRYKRIVDDQPKQSSFDTNTIHGPVTAESIKSSSQLIVNPNFAPSKASATQPCFYGATSMPLPYQQVFQNGGFTANPYGMPMFWPSPYYGQSFLQPVPSGFYNPASSSQSHRVTGNSFPSPFMYPAMYQYMQPISCNYPSMPSGYNFFPVTQDFRTATPGTTSESQSEHHDDLRASEHYRDAQSLASKTYGNSTVRSTSRSENCEIGMKSCMENNICIPEKNWCNNKVDCPDASDESACSCKDRIDKDKFCDGYSDCPFGEDEMGCSDCRPTEFSCDDGTERNPIVTCFSLENRCDGIAHCPNKKDELDCNLLADSVRHHAIFAISYAEGYLHRNYKGKWYPVCHNPFHWASEACQVESGPVTKSPSIQLMNTENQFSGRYIGHIFGNRVEFIPNCFHGKAIYVSCQDIACGSKIDFKLINDQADDRRRRHTDHNDFLNNHLSKTFKDPKESYLYDVNSFNINNEPIFDIPPILDFPTNNIFDNKHDNILHFNNSGLNKQYLVEFDNRLFKFIVDDNFSNKMYTETDHVESFNNVNGLDINIISGNEIRNRRSEARVVGGTKSQPAAWPWAVAMYRDGRFHCGGVLLNERWVLTAAHCVTRYWDHYYEIEVGMLRRLSFSPQVQIHRVSHVIVNNMFNRQMQNDLALMRLATKVRFNRWVRPICLPSLHTAGIDWMWGPQRGTLCTAVGWGAKKEGGQDPDDMNEVDVPITACKDRADKEGQEICAGLESGGKDTCQGDSGGPLLCHNPQHPTQWYVAAVTSHGEGCAKPGDPGAYTRISMYIDWIANNMDSEELPDSIPKQTCPGFTCTWGFKRCLPLKWYCDDKVDCLGGEDETNCPFRNARNSDNPSSLADTSDEVENNISQSSEINSPMNNAVNSSHSDSTAEPNLRVIDDVVLGEKNNEKHITATDSPYFDKQETQSIHSANVKQDSTDTVITEVQSESSDIEIKDNQITTMHNQIENINSTTDDSNFVSNGKFSMGSEDNIRVPKFESEIIDSATAKVQSVSSDVEIEDKQITTMNNQTGSTNNTTNASNFVSNGKLSMSSEDNITVPKFESEIIDSTAAKWHSTEATVAEVKNFDILDLKQTIQTAASTADTPFNGKTEEMNQDFLNNNGDTCGEHCIKEVANDHDDSVSDNPVIAVDRKDKSELSAFERIDFDFNGMNTDKSKIDHDDLESNEFIKIDKVLSNVNTVNDGVTDFENLIDSATDATKIFSANGVENVPNEPIKMLPNEFENPEAANKTETPFSNEVQPATASPSFVSNNVNAFPSKSLIDHLVNNVENGAVNHDTTTVQFHDTNSPDSDVEIDISNKSLEINTQSDDSLINDNEQHTTSKPDQHFLDDDMPFLIDLMTHLSHVDRKDLLHRANSSRAIPVSVVPKLPASDVFTCLRMKQSIPTTLRCDQKPDCEDGSDEENCSCRNYLELSRKYSNLVCDGYIDCTDGSDEKDCHSCPLGYFHCQISRECIPEEDVCNRVNDCQFREDELDCFALTDGHGIHFDKDLRPHLNVEGIVTARRKGKWEPVCDITLKHDEQEGIARHMCKYLGFSEYDRFTFMQLHRDEKFIEIPSFRKKNQLRQNIDVNVPSQNTSAVIDEHHLDNAEVANRHLSSNQFEVLMEIPDVIESCQTLYVQCVTHMNSNMNIHHQPSLDTQISSNNDTLIPDTSLPEEIQELYLWPWLAKVFLDGEFCCTGVLMDLSWVLVESSCFQDREKYISVVVGSKQTIPSVVGPYEQSIPVDYVNFITLSNATMIHLLRPVSYSRYVRPMGLPDFNTKDLQDDEMCIAVGLNSVGEAESIFLQPLLESCSNTQKCFQRHRPKGCASALDKSSLSPWKGIVSCRTKDGWFPSAMYNEPQGICGFKDTVVLPSVTILRTEIKVIMNTNKRYPWNPQPCTGVRCYRGKCVPELNICDGKPDCEFGEDETFEKCEERKSVCSTASGGPNCAVCPVGYMKCRSGECIPKNKFYDGFWDCADKSDEPNFPTCRDYLQLVSPAKICDGMQHCHDRSDEDPAICRCFSKNVFKCRDGSCIANDFMCDGESDCSGNEDETDCLGLLSNDKMLGSGMIVQNTRGLWHTKCFDRPIKQKSDLENLCRELNFFNGHGDLMDEALVSLYAPPTQPHVQQFDRIVINDRLNVTLRNDNTPAALKRFIHSDVCNPVYIECI